MWHASPVGLYENQDPEQAEMNLRGLFTTDAEGAIIFAPCGRQVIPSPRTARWAGCCTPTAPSVPPGAYPFHGHQTGLKTLVTQIFADDAEHLTDRRDVQRHPSMVGHYEQHETCKAPAPGFTGAF